MSQRDCWGWWGNEAEDNDAYEADRPMIPRGWRVIEADMANEADETDEAKAEVTEGNEADEVDKAEKAVVAFESDKAAD